MSYPSDVISAARKAYEISTKTNSVLAIADAIMNERIRCYKIAYDCSTGDLVNWAEDISAAIIQGKSSVVGD